MPENPVITSPTILPWPAGTGNVIVGYAPEALEKLRLDALEGLIALPRIGMGIGGLLLGTREKSGAKTSLRILDSLPIPCSHAQGPSFNLSPDEVREAIELTRPERELAVIGFYYSRTRSQQKRSLEIEQLYTLLCPEPWQILLELRPSMAEPSRAELIYRNGGLSVTGPGIELHPVEVEDIPSTLAPEPEIPVAPISLPASGALPAMEAPAPETFLPPPAPVPAAAAPAAFRAPLFGVPPHPAPRQGAWLRWAIPLLLLAAGSGAAAWFTRDTWNPPPPLQLEVAEKQGQVTFHWNPDALRGQDAAVLLVNDGGDLRTFPLTPQRLDAGVLIYPRKSGRVTGTLRIGDRRAIATFLEPVAPATPPATPPSTSPSTPPAAPPRAAP